MSVLFLLAAVGITIMGVALGIAAKRIAGAWLTFRRRFLVTCPTDGQPASVRVDVRHAAATAWRGASQLRLSGCSHWPERSGCGQPCAAQLAATPQDCLVRTILAKWYDGKYCVRCGTPVGEAYWDVCRLALLTSCDVIEECNQIPAEELPKALETARPVCFNCYVQDKVNPHFVGLGSQPSGANMDEASSGSLDAEHLAGSRNSRVD